MIHVKRLALGLGASAGVFVFMLGVTQFPLVFVTPLIIAVAYYFGWAFLSDK